MTTDESFKEKVKIREQKVKRMSTIFLVALIPVILANQILDRLLSVIFGSNYAPYENIPPFFPIWFALGSTLMVFVFVIAWWYWESELKLVKPAIVTVLILYLCGMGTAAEIGALESHGVTFWEFMPVLWILMIVLFLGSFILSAKAESFGVKIAVIASFFILFAVVHWVFYLPMFPDFSWIGINHALDILIFQWVTAMAVIAIPIIIGMGLLQSDKLRVKLITYDLEKHMARKKK